MNKTIRVGIAIVALLTALIAAQSADMARPQYRPPEFIAPLFTWTGFYVGLNTGYGWAKSEWSGLSGSNLQASPKGFMGGGTLGYNYQTGPCVWGIEAT